VDASEMQELLQGYLSELDWDGGATKDQLVSHLAGRDESLRTMINQYVAEGTYDNLDAVLTVIPAQAWQDVQGDTWRGPEGPPTADAPSRFREGSAGQSRADDAASAAPAGSVWGDATTTSVADVAAFGSALPLDQPERLVPVALSALLEGLGQAYNRQPVKAAGLAILGLSLSTASGLNTWLVRRVFGARRATIGSERIRPVLLVAWAVIYAYNLWDAWEEATGKD
jgi:hypothetical protein